MEKEPSRIFAELKEAVGIQEGLVAEQLALEWGQQLFARFVSLWNQIGNHEELAYEDKVKAQALVLKEASSSVFYLQRQLAKDCRNLERHRRQVRRE